MKNLISIALILLGYLITPLIAQQTSEHRIGLLEAEIYNVDDSHSILKFSVKFMGMVDVEGSFDDFNATIFYNESDLQSMQVVARIDAASINTGNDFRDKDLRSERFFDVDTYPEIIFKSTSIDPSGSGYVMRGMLTIKGIEREIAIPIDHTLERTVDSPWGNVRIGFTGNTKVSRYDYNVTGGDNWGTKMISDEVQIRFSILGRIFNMNKIAYGNREKASIGEILQEKIEKNGIDEAVAFYQKVTESKPDSINNSARELYVLSSRLKQNNEIDKAITIGELYVQAYPDSPSANATMGELKATTGDREGAITYFNMVIKLNPEDKSMIDLAKIALERLKSGKLK